MKKIPNTTKIRNVISTKFGPGDHVDITKLREQLPDFTNQALSTSIWAVCKNENHFKLVDETMSGSKVYEVLPKFFEDYPKSSVRVYKKSVPHKSTPSAPSANIPNELKEIRNHLLDYTMRIERIIYRLENEQ